MIVRSQMGECCAWCAEVAGTYAYDPTHMDKRVFRRHRGCDCLIELRRDGRREIVNNYMNADRRQDAQGMMRNLKRLKGNPYRSIDATAEYFGEAKPGKGKYEQDDGVLTEDIRMAHYLHDTETFPNFV